MDSSGHDYEDQQDEGSQKRRRAHPPQDQWEHNEYEGHRGPPEREWEDRPSGPPGHWGRGRGAPPPYAGGPPGYYGGRGPPPGYPGRGGGRGPPPEWGPPHEWGPPPDWGPHDGGRGGRGEGRGGRGGRMGPPGMAPPMPPPPPGMFPPPGMMGGRGGMMPPGGPYMPGPGAVRMGRGLGGVAGRGPGISRGKQNDYCQHFVDTGERPLNFIRDASMSERFSEYPMKRELLDRKDALIDQTATPPMYLQCDLRTMELSPRTLGTLFDVILVDPPWEEYERRAPGASGIDSWPWQDIMNLKIEDISDTPSFLFLWCGCAEGLDAGRHCLRKWGFRRCEDICWLKSNKDKNTRQHQPDDWAILHHTKEHCLMGIKGTVRRNQDGHLIHANVDTDVLLSEQPPFGSTAKPEEMYHIIEHFAQGRRRLELFGEDHNIRRGWVTLGRSLSASNFNPETYSAYFKNEAGFRAHDGKPTAESPVLVGTTPEIELLRPKSPPQWNANHSQPVASTDEATEEDSWALAKAEDEAEDA